MKSYLSLIPISARVHKRQNRMTRLCIIFAVFLVTAIFSMADMGVRMEKARLTEKHGAGALIEMGHNQTVQLLYSTAAVLFILIMIAGILMIASSINSNVAQRTKFFGMMRCIGMSREQIIRFVRLEALNWCRTAVPAGVIMGILVTWILCAALKFLVGEEFVSMPLFGISPIGIVSGMVVGLVTVLIAAGSPARRAAKVSPAAAVSGHLESSKLVMPAIKCGFFKIETVLGIQHAFAAKKNLVLMISSFALSIILFLSFSVLTSLVGYLMPQTSNHSDLNISRVENTNEISPKLIDKIENMHGVKRVWGRRSSLKTPVKIKGVSDTADIISYADFDLHCLKKDKLLKKGSAVSKVYGNSQYVLAVWDQTKPLKAGDKVQIGDDMFEIAGLLKYDPFSSDGEAKGQMTLIMSDETFTRVTGESGYSLVMVQTKRDVTDQDVMAIKKKLDKNEVLTDGRDENTAGTYGAFMAFVYGFLGIITLVAVLNIMNSISMSVSARVKQYGAMRAVGMEGGQLTRMIVAEAMTYAISGCITGCILGILISKFLYERLITAHFSYAIWQFPLLQILVIVGVVIIAAGMAVYFPAKRIRNMSVTKTINEL